MPEAKKTSFNVEAIREQFPVLHQKVNGYPLVYFDNAASTQKPQRVIDRISHYYRNFNSNVHRGVHHLSQKATDAYETSRQTVRSFINAEKEHEVIFTKGTTDAINLVASAFAEKYLKKDDEIILTRMEHHSNIVPWQIACEKSGAKIKVAPINEKGELLIDELYALFNDNTALLALPAVSNTLGTINPVKEIIAEAHKHNVPVLVDGAQAVAHAKTDVQDLDCDFFCFSGHKMFGPTGTGILYGKEKWLEDMPPYQGGGEMIDQVTFEKTTYGELPHKFEAGTPHISGVIGLDEAIRFINSVGIENIARHEGELLCYAIGQLNKFSGIRYIGEAEHRAAVISYIPENIHPYDAGTILDQMGIAIRTGHHCTQPLMDFFEIPGTARASFSLYNTIEEVDQFVEGMNKVQKMLA